MKKKRRLGRRVLLSLTGLAVSYFVVALVMIGLPLPKVPPADAMSKEEAVSAGMTVEQFYQSERVDFTMRDGVVLRGARYPAASPHSIVFLHGASGYSSQLNKCIGQIRAAVGIEVFTYDHRGHGNSPGERGHLDHVDQYATDLSDVLKAVKSTKKNGKIILAGHSMGGGIIQRFAISDEPKYADSYLLFAPVLGAGIPGEQIPGFIKLHKPRVMGILMLKLVGIDWFDQLPVINMGFPQYEGHINQYTLNAAFSMRPDDFESGMESLQRPTLIVLGDRDTATGVTAEKAAESIRIHSNANVMIISDQGHHVQNSSDAIAEVADWLKEELK
jgi:alpha-beta hydrolase superfamily lysophospholipase